MQLSNQNAPQTQSFIQKYKQSQPVKLLVKNTNTSSKVSFINFAAQSQLNQHTQPTNISTMNHSQSQKSINQVAPRSALTRSAFSSKDLQLKHNVRNQSQFNQYIESAASSYNTSQVTFKQSRPHSQYLISSTSKPNKLQEDQEQHQQQDLYLKDFQQNRRKQIEQQNKQAESLIKEMQLQKSQSTSNIGFTLKKNVQDRHIPGLKQFIAEKHSASKVWNFNQSQNQSYQSEIKQRTEKLNEIQQQNKYFYGKLEDHYETEDKLRAQNYFNSNIRDKLESQNNDLPASLVALQYNRKFILDQMINRKGYFSSKDQLNKLQYWEFYQSFENKYENRVSEYFQSPKMYLKI